MNFSLCCRHASFSPGMQSHISLLLILLGHKYVYVYTVVYNMYREEYHLMKKQWKSFSEVQLQRFQLFEEHRELIRK